MVRKEIFELGRFVAYSIFLSVHQTCSFIVEAMRNVAINLSYLFFLTSFKIYGILNPKETS